MNSLPTELISIIFDYKEKFEAIDETFKYIDQIMTHNEDVLSLKTDISYIDLKEYLFRRNITHLKIQLHIYGEGHINNNKFWDLDLIRDDDQMLDGFFVNEIVYSPFMNKLYLKFYQEEEVNDSNENYIKKQDNSYLIDDDMDEDDIDFYMSLV
jgi:hypothetical protein